MRFEAAKMDATHVTYEFMSGSEGVIGVAYDCKRFKAVARAIDVQRAYIKNRAMSELERRDYAKGKNKPLAPLEIPVFKYDGNK